MSAKRDGRDQVGSVTTIDRNTDSLSAVWHAITGGRFRVRLDDPKAPAGKRSGAVLDDRDEVLGTASDYIYGGAGFCVHTRAFGGYVALEQIEFVEAACPRSGVSP